MDGPLLPLTTTQVAALLRSLPVALHAEAAGLGSDGLRWHPAPGEWCVNEVVGHVIEAERRGFAGRIRDIIDGKELDTWDQEQVARDRNDCARDGLELLAELDALRGEGIRLVEGLAAEQLALSGMQPDVGELRVVDLLHEWIHHDRAHLKQALANVQAYAWPHMGNAQRFSEMG